MGTHLIEIILGCTLRELLQSLVELNMLLSAISCFSSLFSHDELITLLGLSGVLTDLRLLLSLFSGAFSLLNVLLLLFVSLDAGLLELLEEHLCIIIRPIGVLLFLTLEE